MLAKNCSPAKMIPVIGYGLYIVVCAYAGHMRQGRTLLFVNQIVEYA